METPSKFVLGLNAGFLGRWSRLTLGRALPLITIIRALVLGKASFEFLSTAALYFIAIFAVYLATHYFLGERLLARVNPWVGTIILVGPPSIALPFRLCLQLSK